jgi:hypothetical protein
MVLRSCSQRKKRTHYIVQSCIVVWLCGVGNPFGIGTGRQLQEQSRMDGVYILFSSLSLRLAGKVMSDSVGEKENKKKRSKCRSYIVTSLSFYTVCVLFYFFFLASLLPRYSLEKVERCIEKGKVLKIRVARYCLCVSLVPIKIILSLNTRIIYTASHADATR